MPAPILRTRKLRRARRMAGLSVAALAKRVGMAPTFICIAESGRYIPSEDQLRRMASAIGFPPELDVWVLLDPDPTPEAVSAPRRKPETKEEKEGV